MADKVDLGLGANVRKKVAEGLADVLADHYLLALKTQNFHWNVTGGETWEEMCTQFAADNDSPVKACRKLGDMADEAGDTETGDLMNGRKEEMAKAAWMLRSHVG